MLVNVGLDSLEFVTKDRGGDWYFDGKQYLFFQKGKPSARIFPQHIPDPEILFQTKLKKMQIRASDPKAKKLISSKTVYNLWEHRNAKFN